MEFTCDSYMLKPYPNGLCWELLEFRTVAKGTEKEREDWVSCGYYPSTFGQGLQMIYERLLRRSKTKARDIQAAMEEARRIYDSLGRRTK